MLRVGLIAEGKCVWHVLRAMMRRWHPNIEFQELQPDETLTSKRSFGWIGVRAWCQEFGSQLEDFMTSFGEPLHLLVIHVDCSMARVVGAERPCPPCSDTVEALVKVVDETWLMRVPRPAFVVLAMPSMTTDTWVVATLDDPPYKNLAAIECDRAAEDQLTRPIWGPIKRLGWKKGEINKSGRAYLPFAERVGENLSLLLVRCPQAEAFRADFERAVASVPTI